MTRPLFSVVVLTRAQNEIDSADLWWSEHRENLDAVRDEFRKFCELVVVFPEIGTLVAVEGGGATHPSPGYRISRLLSRSTPSAPR